VIVLGESTFEEMQDNLGILRIILIPRVVHGFSGASKSDGRNELEMKTLGVEKISKRSMVVARWFKVRDTLGNWGYDFAGIKNPLAFFNTILQRLAEQGEIVRSDTGRPFRFSR
jgi:hypothetical protein